ALAQFANDPFLVLRALSAAGRLLVHDRIPSSLASVPLVGRTERFDLARTHDIVIEISERVFRDLVAAVVSHDRVAVLTSGNVERLLQSLLHALPLEQRLSVSFTTGLKDSPRRPF